MLLIWDDWSTKVYRSPTRHHHAIEENIRRSQLHDDKRRHFAVLFNIVGGVLRYVRLLCLRREDHRLQRLTNVS